MPRITWDEVGERRFESGLDRGVLYPPGRPAVPWNGITGVTENFNAEIDNVYYDGQKIHDIVIIGDYSATLNALTYPDEFLDLEGIGLLREGIRLTDQKPKPFGLTYRTFVGNDVDGQEAGYKIHILYNVTAIPSDKTYASLTNSPSLTEFAWDLSTVPVEIDTYHATSHIIIDSTKVDPYLMRRIEDILYGSTIVDASLPPISDLVHELDNWVRLSVIDHRDGTWSAIEGPGAEGVIIRMITSDEFEITTPSAIYLDSEKYNLSTDTGIRSLGP